MKIRNTLLLLPILISLVVPEFVSAQSAQSLSVTPPLFQLSVQPGDIWQSTVKVVNSNDYDLEVFAEVVNFVSIGEEGHGRFEPVFDDQGDGVTLAEWIDIPPGPYKIAPGLSRQLSFILDIPTNAAPGSHSAAVLITTKPPSNTGDSNLQLSTSQAVSAIFLLRIEGDVVESASIREFSVDKTFTPDPQADFLLRFENTGNVHLQPQGFIVIKNMWGTERGIIPINQASRFGNVFPEATRAFRFSWQGESSLADIGRYTAEITLGYGQTQRQNLTRTISFWVIPLKGTLITLGVLVVFLLFVAWMVRLYVRRMLLLAGVEAGGVVQTRSVKEITKNGDISITVSKERSVTAPLKAGAADLRSRLENVHAFFDVLKTLGGFVWTYKLFFSFVAIVTLAFILFTMFIVRVTDSDKSYVVTIGTGEEQETIDSEALKKESLPVDSESPVNLDQAFSVSLINASGRSGEAAELAVILEERGYRIDEIKTDLDRVRQSTVIIFNPDFQSEAEALSSTLGGALLSAQPPDVQDSYDIVIYVGKN